jgi:hypothetical protein
MVTTVEAPALERPDKTQLARIVFFVFLLTFMLARILVFLIMSRRIPDLYLHLGGSHIHHLNYGIFLLAGLGGYFLFGNLEGRELRLASVIYGIGLALTFDEFGMWVRLGGSYWQRASVDAVGVVAALLGLIAYAPSLKNFRPRHWGSAVILAAAMAVFSILLADSFQYAHRIIGPRLYQIESGSPPSFHKADNVTSGREVHRGCAFSNSHRLGVANSSEFPAGSRK